MPRLDTVLVLLLATPALSFANPAPVGNRVAVDHAWAERDAREVREFEQLTVSLKDAWKSRMAGRYREVNESLLHAMDHEIQQASVKADQATREATLWREFRKQRMESSVTGAGSDMLKVIDDRYEQSDGASDRDTAMLRRDDMVRIGTMAGSLRNDISAGDRSAMKRNMALAEKFLSVMRRDLAATQQERVEDRVADRR